MKKQEEEAEERICYDEHINHKMEQWQNAIAAEPGFENFPVNGVRIDPGKVDRSFFEKGAMQWVFTYYKNHRPLITNVDRAYRSVNYWLGKMTPSQILQLNSIQSFEVLCCRVWTLFVTEEYGMF